MQKRSLGFLLAILGFGGMILAGYIFVTGSGGRVHLIEVTVYMIAGATCFFAGINNIYESANAFTKDHLELTEEFEEISPIQEQWRTIHIAKPPVAQVNNSVKAEAV